MTLTFDAFSHFAGTWGLAFLLVMFASALAYALWPMNKDKFERAAMAPLEDDHIADVQFEKSSAREGDIK